MTTSKATLPVKRVFMKPQKLKIKGKIRPGTTRTYSLNFGDYGLYSLEKGRLTTPQMEEVEKTIQRVLKKKGKLWIRAWPNINVTKKPVGARMGKGRGAVSHKVARVREGMILCEVAGVPEYIAEQALLKADKKLAVQTKIIKRPFVLPPEKYF